MERTLLLNTTHPEAVSELLGLNGENLSLIETRYDIQIIWRQELLIFPDIENELYQKLSLLLETLLKRAENNQVISEADMIYALNLMDENRLDELAYLNHHVISKTVNGVPVYAKTIGQQRYLEAMDQSDMVFAIGPAGTGKTYLAVVKAVLAFRQNRVKRIILTRPAVEAGESLGFLPGDLKEKVDPYLRPLYDALYDLLGYEKTERMIEKGIIEIAPLAYMRGRTLEDAFVILDEAQNTTDAQMKMFLTRMGFHSRMIITGDITQIDLKSGMTSGLLKATQILKDIKEIRFVYLTALDVVRHPLVSKIIASYER